MCGRRGAPKPAPEGWPKLDGQPVSGGLGRGLAQDALEEHTGCLDVPLKRLIAEPPQVDCRLGSGPS